jgi:hypothetical protein
MHGFNFNSVSFPILSFTVKALDRDGNDYVFSKP